MHLKYLNFTVYVLLYANGGVDVELQLELNELMGKKGSWELNDGLCFQYLGFL